MVRLATSLIVKVSFCLLLACFRRSYSFEMKAFPFHFNDAVFSLCLCARFPCLIDV